MKKLNLIKVSVVAVTIIIGLTVFLLVPKSEMQTITPDTVSTKEIEGKSKVTGYKNWAKVNNKPVIMASRVAMMCVRPTKEQIKIESGNPHNDKYINVFVNSIGKNEMMTKKHPQFPEGTVIVKEKLSSFDNTSPELLTVMIKREKEFNPQNGDWEYMTLNGDATEVTARGKIESCQTCHAVDKLTDYVSRRYLPSEIRKKLK